MNHSEEASLSGTGLGAVNHSEEASFSGTGA